MPFEVVMPRLGWNMETGVLGQWLKRDGEFVEAGQPLLTVESEKAAQEVEALENGILHIPPNSPPIGAEVAVGTLLGYLLAEGENWPGALAAAGAAGSRPAAPDEPAHRSSGAVADASQTREPAGLPAISPRARRVAQQLNVAWTALTGGGSTGRIVERDVRQAAARASTQLPTGLEQISPVARRVAADLGVDLNALAAQQPGKRIERADVEAAAQASEAIHTAKAPAAPPTERPIGEPAAQRAPGDVAPISAIRRITAERMAASAHTTAPVTLTSEVDATELVRLHRQLKSVGTQPVPSYTDILVKLTAQTLLEFPAVNARFEGEGIWQAPSAHIGIAVDTDRGLLVPVLRDVPAKSLRQLARESAELIAKARAGNLGSNDMQGGTFTVTNLGMYGIDAFTPIINLPECAILGVGRIVAKQVVVDVEAERVAIRHMLFLSLTFDHRLVDGGPAARFLQRIALYIAQPYLWLAG